MSKKPVIVFEGIEGSGKTFHAKLVSSYLKKNKVPFIKIREPGGSKNSERIRKLILDRKSKFNKDTDLLLYIASRSENIQNLKKNYKKKVILIDRFIDSTMAYQHYGFGVNSSIINSLNKFILKDFKVNFTFLNIVNNKNMKKRLKKRKKLNRYDKFSPKFYSKIQKGFLKIASKKKNKYKIIDSNQSIEKNRIIVIKNLKKLIK